MNGILAEKFYPWKAWMFSIDITEELLKIRSGQKGLQSYCPHTLKSDMFIEPAESEPIYLVEI